MTSEKIPLDELKYWSVARQEAYADARISLEREIEMNPALRQRSEGLRMRSRRAALLQFSLLAAATLASGCTTDSASRAPAYSGPTKTIRGYLRGSALCVAYGKFGRVRNRL